MRGGVVDPDSSGYGTARYPAADSLATPAARPSGRPNVDIDSE